MAFWEDWRCCGGKDGDCCDYDCDWTTVLIWAAIILVLGGAIAALVIAFGVVFAPKATADDALLQRFALAPGTPASNSTVSYDVTVTVSLRNPNIYRTIQYGPISLTFSYNGSRFDDSAVVRATDTKPRKTTTLRVQVTGAGKPVKLGAAGVAEFRAENATGVFDVEMRMDTVLRYKGRGATCPTSVICPLQLQLVDPDVAATAFQRTKCVILRAKKSGC
ncbi:hypothetical protein U9M48_011103 [Paspalum notatum var. saurae]|uniref:Late embryogenesis abundant protein LEA-2 subgroup domain-containing protein n=1 Tax=Paspalum notatum var. saurae TaxID=547442 RepID=A0AAQ3SUZ3_PASNO